MEEQKKSVKELREERRLELEAKEEAERLEKELQEEEKRRAALLDMIKTHTWNLLFRNQQRTRRVVTDRVVTLAREDRVEVERRQQQTKTLLKAAKGKYEESLKAWKLAYDAEVKSIYTEEEKALNDIRAVNKPAYLEAELLLEERLNAEEEICKVFLKSLEDVTLEKLESIAIEVKGGHLTYDTARPSKSSSPAPAV